MLPLPRGGLRVSGEDSAVYAELVATVRAHATNDYMYCTPDCPEAYFLAGLQNPTPTTFEFLNASPGERDRTLRAISDHRVGVVVLNGQFRFSTPDSALEEELDGSTRTRRVPATSPCCGARNQPNDYFAGCYAGRETPIKRMPAIPRPRCGGCRRGTAPEASSPTASGSFRGSGHAA